MADAWSMAGACSNAALCTDAVEARICEPPGEVSPGLPAGFTWGFGLGVHLVLRGAILLGSCPVVTSCTPWASAQSSVWLWKGPDTKDNPRDDG